MEKVHTEFTSARNLLKICSKLALAIDVKEDDSTATHAECVCKPCKLTIVYARGIGVPMKHIIPFQWYAHKAEGCIVRNKVQINNYTHVRRLCEYFQKTCKGVRMVKLIRQTGVWPSTLIKHIQVIAPATVTGPGCPGPLTICLAQANWNALNALWLCALRSFLSQLSCSAVFVCVPNVSLHG